MEFWLKICFLTSCVISVVTAFSWSNCGKSTDPIKIVSLDAYSNQTKILYVTGKGKVAGNLTSPFKGQVEMYKKFFWGWTKIPCVEQVGSCTYHDICEKSPYKDGKPCPSEFTKNGLPCRCPILEVSNPGQYSAKRFPIDLEILPNWIEEGSYRIKLKLSKDNTDLLCLLVYINF